MIRVDKCSMKNMALLADAEISTQEFPLIGPDLKPYFADANKDALAATITKTFVGYALVTLIDLESKVMIDSIATHKNFRRKGVAKKLVESITAKAKQKGLKVQMEVASYLIEDKTDPWNIEQWLWRAGFKAVAERPDACFRYGRNYCTYIFEKIQ